ncbi:hypothetical protein D9Q98_003420 [Chlorella vulgaris]|uniref:WW domain-containing protein n=1 Tax=Chlorella vulgaris TaxID=3077 RepID=A0A9D4TSK8_CHLVU|nr:hypothetical protein D9Q98_003420 [Chlorella vulgaris]
MRSKPNLWTFILLEGTPASLLWPKHAHEAFAKQAFSRKLLPLSPDSQPRSQPSAQLSRMHSAGFGLGQHPQYPQYPPPGAGGPSDPSAGGQPGMADSNQIQQLVQLLGAKMLPKQTAVVECPKSMVGRVIGKGGETIKSLQQYTGAMIQIDQSTDPTRVTIAGSPQSLQLAVSMVNDIVRGTFKGFAMLRQIALSTSQPGMPGYGQPQPVYVQGYGFVPPSQVYNPDDPLAAQMMRSSPPSGPLTPPMTPLRGPPSAGALGGAGLTPEALAALLGQQGGMPGMPDFSGAAGSQDALLGQLLGQLAGQQQAPPPATMNLQQHQQLSMTHQHQQQAGEQMGGADPATIQALLAQAGLLGNGQQQSIGMNTHNLPTSSAAGMGTSSGLMLNAQMPLSAGSSSPAHSTASVPVNAPLSARAAPSQGPTAHSYLGTSPTATHSSAGSGSGRASPGVPLAAANPSLTTRRPTSDTGSPLGLYGAVGSPSSHGAGSIGAAAEEALAAKMGAASITSVDLGSGVGEQGMLPPGWAKVTDGQGLVYYVNHVTQESSLTRPSAQGQAAM